MSEIRSEVIRRRTYNRELEDGVLETWSGTIARVIRHQRWLWERALTMKSLPDMPLHDITPDMNEWKTLNVDQEMELINLEALMLERKALPSGRTLWLGGTDIAKRREASQFNCAFTHVETVYDVVDVFWLLLNGTGVGFKPIVGTLTGFRTPIHNVKVIRSEKTVEDGKGRESNEETLHDGVWTISVGDSAEAWAKSIGKLIGGKKAAHSIVLDLSEIRSAGVRLKGYGWISSGDGPLADAYTKIIKILTKRSNSILSKIDILDIMNLMGTVLSSRRSAEIALVEYGSSEWYEFAKAKEHIYEDPELSHRQMSNNSLVFDRKPSKDQLEEIFRLMVEAGGSEPGFINGEAALKRAPWFKGVNPCAEILLGNKSFCNLVEINISAYVGNPSGLLETARLAARANYRQTVVDFRDGVLQEAWHLNNEFLRLCGVGITGIVQREDMTEYEYKDLRYTIVSSARGMADELELQHPKNVTTVKPSGTLSKVMVTTEGGTKPLGKYIFNWIQFNKYDPLVSALQRAGYDWIVHPSDDTGILVCFPVEYDNVKFSKVSIDRSDGTIEDLEINKDSAIEQLERYKKLQVWYCDHNVSNTINYDVGEIPDIIDWLLTNWDIYVGVSFIYRSDPTMSARDLGYQYLPQEVVTKERYTDYVERLGIINWENTDSIEEISNEDCASGVCPIK